MIFLEIGARTCLAAMRHSKSVLGRASKPLSARNHCSNKLFFDFEGTFTSFSKSLSRSLCFELYIVSTDFEAHVLRFSQDDGMALALFCDANKQHREIKTFQEEVRETSCTSNKGRLLPQQSRLTHTHTLAPIPQ